ncbi:MAG: hypothetical protein ACLSHF_14235 [[Eubacterium] siraeum]
MAFHSVGAVLEGLEVPEDKHLDNAVAPGYPVTNSVVAAPPTNDIPLPDDNDYPF